MGIISQIYEIQTPDEAVEMIRLGVDHIGSVVLPDYDIKKNTCLKDTVDTVKKNDKVSSVIPLFSDFDRIMSVIDWLEPNILHMCENISYEDDYKEKKNCELLYELQHKLKMRNKNLEFMRSVPILSTASSDDLKEKSKSKIDFYRSVFSEISSYFLTDTIFEIEDKNQPVPGFVGITGKTCDWSLAEYLVSNSNIPVILAGGLSPENVYEAIINVRPFGADSCSNTNVSDENDESVRFKKDYSKVKKFVREIKRAEEKIN